MSDKNKTAVEQQEERQSELIKLMALEILELKAIRDLVAEMFNDSELGTFGVMNSNGADSMNCQACYAEQQVMGNCGHHEGLYSVEVHDPNCNLVKLSHLVNKSVEADEEAEDRLLAQQLAAQSESPEGGGNDGTSREV